MSLELEILQLHLGDEPLSEQLRDTVMTMVANFGIKGMEIPGARGMLGAAIMTTWTIACRTPCPGILELGHSMGSDLVKAARLWQSGTWKRHSHHTTPRSTSLSFTDWRGAKQQRWADRTTTCKLSHLLIPAKILFAGGLKSSRLEVNINNALIRCKINITNRTPT